MNKTLLEDSIALLRKMVATPSLSREESQVCTLISGALRSWGIEHRIINGNIVAFNKKYDPAKPTLALDAHMDTVRPAESYLRDPFDPGDDPKTVYGLGSNDDGGSVVSMIAAMRHFYDADMPINLALVICREEEVSGAEGSAYIYSDKGPFKNGEPRWTIFGEPTQMKVATSERGLIVLDGEAVGVSGHAARAEGVNALYIALEDIERLRSHKFARVSQAMGEVKVNVTMINAGTAHNVIPDSCRFVVDVRPTDKYSNGEIVSELQELCNSRLTPRSLHHSASATKSDSLLLEVASDLDFDTFSSPTTSDWIFCRGEGIKMGPGDSARSHRADEFIKTSEIADAIDKYILFISTLYGNTLE